MVDPEGEHPEDDIQEAKREIRQYQTYCKKNPFQRSGWKVKAKNEKRQYNYRYHLGP